MSPGDDQLIESIHQSARGGARVLCGLARRGKALERDEPQRAALLLGTLSTHPLYKGGRLAFDMLEIEDVMLEEPSIDPPSFGDLTEAFGAAVGTSSRLAEVLMRLGAEAQRSGPASPEGLPRVRLAPAPDPGRDPTEGIPEDRDFLPHLNSSDYLFDYVVLGFLDLISRRLDNETG